MKKICKNCGFIGSEKKSVKGSLLSEVALYMLGLFFLLILTPAGIIILVAALIYSIWRIVAPKEKICPKCKNNAMIPLDTPIGQELAKKYNIDISK